MSYLTQPPHADALAIAAILSSRQGSTASDAAVQVAQEVLKNSAVGCDATPRLRASVALHGGRTFATCHGDGIAVMFMGRHALVFSTDGAGEVPWVRSDRLHAPDVDFFKCRVTVGQHVSDSLVTLVQPGFADAACNDAPELDAAFTPCP